MIQWFSDGSLDRGSLICFIFIHRSFYQYASLYTFVDSFLFLSTVWRWSRKFYTDKVVEWRCDANIFSSRAVPSSNQIFRILFDCKNSLPLLRDMKSGGGGRREKSIASMQLSRAGMPGTSRSHALEQQRPNQSRRSTPLNDRWMLSAVFKRVLKKSYLSAGSQRRQLPRTGLSDSTAASSRVGTSNTTRIRFSGATTSYYSSSNTERTGRYSNVKCREEWSVWKSKRCQLNGEPRRDGETGMEGGYKVDYYYYSRRQRVCARKVQDQQMIAAAARRSHHVMFLAV